MKYHFLGILLYNNDPNKAAISVAIEITEEKVQLP